LRALLSPPLHFGDASQSASGEEILKQIAVIALLVVLLTSCSTHEVNVPTLTTQPQATAGRGVQG
ncbi:MAG TPA: hypothetical protein VFQ13_07390, partial [Anaerolineales bacterium]|nr:hypothetical protein [Anaerolineales bacterium]